MRHRQAFKGHWSEIVVRVQGDIIDRDAFDAPIFDSTEKTIDRVLVHPELGKDIASTGVRLNGHKIQYSLAIPKGVDIDFENADVLVEGEWYHVIGAPKKQPESVTPYDLIVYVEKEHG